jgi:O-antigen/teichoic acid export membrane protein
LQAMPLLAMSVPVATLTGVLTGALQGREKFLETNKISVLFTTLFQILPIVVAWFHGPQLMWLLAAALASRAVALVLLWLLCHKDILVGHPIKASWSTIRALLGYGGWVSFNALIGPVLVIVDRFAIGAVLGATAVAYYTVPFQIAKRITILPGALSNALFPKLAIASPDKAIELGQKSLATVVSAITPPVLIAILFIEPFLRLWVGHNVASLAAPTGRVLLIGYWLNALALLPFIRLQASGRPNIVTYNLLMQIPFYLAALYFGMTYFGLVGCALALSARFGVDLIMQQRGANGRLEGLSVTLFPLGLLCAASLVFTIWGYGDIAGWACAAGLIIISFIHAWRSAPAELQSLVHGFVVQFNLRFGRIWGRAR